ncbi:hypothetical protein QLX08_007564 [Tetragonisca angustula]|uniref:Uncharacterized protein n=1 Tax=Tetragonisca angustula TaxID=166442 RepID=A0AAW0ZNL8_9HYME
MALCSSKKGKGNGSLRERKGQVCEERQNSFSRVVGSSSCRYVDFLWHWCTVCVYCKWLRYSASQIDETPSLWRLVNAQPCCLG